MSTTDVPWSDPASADAVAPTAPEDSSPRLPPEVLAELSRIRPLWSVLPFVWTWGLIAATAYLQIRSGRWYTLPLAWLLIARSQHALAILMHEGAHGRLWPGRTLNDGLGSWLAGYPVLISMRAYRRVHLVHHRDPLGPGDPDTVLTSGYPVTPSTLLRRLLRDLAGISFVKVLSYLMTGKTRRARLAERGHRSAGQPRTSSSDGAAAAERARSAEPERSPLREDSARGRKPADAVPAVLRALGVQAVLLGVFWMAGHPLHYLLLWLLPLATVLQVLLRLRGLADHAGLPEPLPDQPLPQFRRTRSVRSNPFTRFVLAPLNVGYHLEHHLFAGIPWYHLRRAHRLLSAEWQALDAPVEAGYWSVLRRLTTPGHSPPS
jgi:fatty acid desaturase